MTLIGLTGATAKLVIGKQEYTFPLAEVDALWSGVLYPPMETSLSTSNSFNWLVRQRGCLGSAGAQ